MIIKLRMLMLLGLLISGFVFFSGCVQEKALTVSNETLTVQPTTSTEIYCVSNETGKKMSLSEAREIAKNSVIGDQGTLKDTYSCNESTSTWWIDMKPTIEQYACNPAYVVNINTKEVEINWRCTEAIIRWP
ncbi:hypothetical protein METP3_03188 [Methanosarcinales archaeon]|nr:hypothetical protein METP3_03188 [Methanosarcinales archaeon]